MQLAGLCPFNVLWESICSSPTSKLRSSRLSTLDGVREKWASLAVPCTAGEARSPLRVLSLFPTEEIKGKKVSPGTELCHLEERGDTSQVKIFPYYSLQRTQTCIWFAPTACWNFSTAHLDFHQGSLIYGKVLQGLLDCSWEGPQPVHGPLHDPQPGLSSASLLPGALVGAILPRSL